MISVLVAAIVSAFAGWVAAWIVRRQTLGASVPTAVMAGSMCGLGIWAALVMPANFLLLATLMLGWTLLVLATVDVLVFRLPDTFTLPLMAAGLLLSLRLPDHDPLAHVIGAAAGFIALYGIALAYRHARGREGLGLGDAKLASAAGAWLGWQALPSVVLVACAAAFIWIGVALWARGRDVLSRELAFGAPLCFAFWLVWLHGAPF